MKRIIRIGIDVDEFKHPTGHRGFTLEKLKDNWSAEYVHAIIQSLRTKAPVEHNGKTLRAFVISNQLVEE